MSIADTTKGSTSAPAVIAGTTSQAESPRPAGIADDIGLVLAQIPDLDAKAAPKRHVTRIDARLLSQALSLKMVFGVGIGLVIGAILPSLFGRGNHASKVRELPAWNARTDAPAAPATAQTEAPRWAPAQPQTTVVTPQVPPAGVSPQPPQVGEYRPAALGRPSWTPPRASAAPPSAPQATGNVNPDYARNSMPAASAAERSYGPPADRRDWQADNRSDPATRYRNATTYDYRGNPIETPAPRRDGQVPGGAPDYRYDNGIDASGARPGSPLMPAGATGAGNYRNPQDNDPGVARFDGTIAPPPARTN